MNNPYDIKSRDYFKSLAILQSLNYSKNHSTDKVTLTAFTEAQKDLMQALRVSYAELEYLEFFVGGTKPGASLLSTYLPKDNIKLLIELGTLVRKLEKSLVAAGLTRTKAVIELYYQKLFLTV